MTEQPGHGTMEIREATDADWPAGLAGVPATVRAGETYAFDPDMPEDVARSLWMERPPGSHRRGGRRAASCSARPRWVRTAAGAVRTSARPASWSAPAARGRGVGRALATYVVDWHRREGYRAIQFNAVVETNTAAVALWQVARLHASSARCPRRSTTRSTATSACTSCTCRWSEAVVRSGGPTAVTERPGGGYHGGNPPRATSLDNDVLCPVVGESTGD